MNVFVLGHTQSGKSTLARYIAEKYGFNHIEASGNLRDIVPQIEGETNKHYVNRLSDKSKEILFADPYHFSKSISDQMQITGNNVISGIRNPIDLFKLADFKRDLIIYITQYNVDNYSDFERRGLHAIVECLPFLTTYINPECYFCYKTNLEKTTEENFSTNIWKKKYLHEYFN